MCVSRYQLGLSRCGEIVIRYVLFLLPARIIVLHRYTRYVLFSLPAGIVAVYPMCSLLITSQNCRVLPVVFSSHYQTRMSRSNHCVLFSLSTMTVAFYPLCSLLIINQDCCVLPVVFSSHYQPGTSRCTEIATRCVLNSHVVQRSLPVVFSTVAL